MRLVRHHDNRDHAAAAALLQDVGQLIRASCEPDVFGPLLRRAVEEHRPLHEVEHEAQGFTHADVGAYLLTLWGLPPEVVDAVSHHHHAMSPGSRVDLSVTEAVRTAHLLVQTQRPSAADPSDPQPVQAADTEVVEALAASTLDRWTQQAAFDEEDAVGFAGAAL
jgi:HD-like signal output (HDOD) protein